MTNLQLFLIGILLSFSSSLLLAALFAWPQLKALPKYEALLWVVAPHTLLRFIGLSFLVTGVVAPSLPRDFALPVAYGDVLAGLLAILATIGLAQKKPWAIGAAWIFTVWGAADFLMAFYQGPHCGLAPGDLGATYFIPTTLVPILFVTHLLALRLLTRKT